MTFYVFYFTLELYTPPNINNILNRLKLYSHLNDVKIILQIYITRTKVNSVINCFGCFSCHRRKTSDRLNTKALQVVLINNKNILISRVYLNKLKYLRHQIQ